MSQIQRDIKAVPATQVLVDLLKGHLRAADEMEARSAAGCSVDVGMQKSFETAEGCWVLLCDEKPVAIVGVCRGHAGRGYPWFLATNEIEQPDVKYFIARYGARFLRDLLGRFSLLENWVHAMNTESLNWLERLGFRIEMPRKWGVKGDPFCRVSIQGD